MADASSNLKGVIHGRVIELDRTPGLPDGQEVAVTLEPVTAESPTPPPRPTPEEARRLLEQVREEVKDLPPGEGLRRAFGSWAEDAEEIDRFLEWSRAQRRAEGRATGP